MSRSAKNPFVSLMTVVACHLVLLFIFYCILSFFGFIKGMPGNDSLVRFDVVFYKSIVDSGYSYIPGTQSNIAFFPLFPAIWHFLHTSPMGISCVNLLLMLAGVVLLQKTYQVKLPQLLVLLSTPSLFFCYIPYSEAMFFLASAVFLYGLEKNTKVAILGIFLACLTRSASTIFIPALIFTLFITFKKGKEPKKQFLKYGLLMVSSLLALLVTQLIQYFQTGYFFKFFEVQKHWGRDFKIPTFYLTTWDGVRLIWLDGLAFFVGVVCLVICAGLLIRKLKNWSRELSPSFVFSVTYLGIVTLIILFFSCVDTFLDGTSIFSLNRFVFATPYFFVFLVLSAKYFKINLKNTLVFVIIAVIVWSLFNANGYLSGLSKYTLPVFKTKLYFALAFLYSLVYFLMLKVKIHQNTWSGLYVFNLIIQVYLFNCFCNDLWVG